MGICILCTVREADPFTPACQRLEVFEREGVLRGLAGLIAIATDVIFMDVARVSVTKLKDIAEAAGVSINTVSRVLSGKTKGTYASSAKKVELIFELARSMDYSPNKIAQAMRTRRTYQIVIIVHELHNLYTSRTLTLANNELAKRGYNLLLRLIQKEDNMESDLSALSRNLIDGVLCSHPFIEPELLQDLMQDIPVVFIDRSPDFSPAMLNMESGVLLGMQHLWNLGHERIAIISGSNPLSSRSRRIEAYRTFYASHSMEPPQDWIMQKGWGFWDAEALVDQFLETGCTACFLGNDALGMGFCNGLRMKGYEVPKDFSVVTIDDTVLSRMNYPELTSIHLPSHRLVEITIQGLLAKIEGLKHPRFQLLMPELIVRDSTRPIK